MFVKADCGDADDRDSDRRTVPGMLFRQGKAVSVASFDAQGLSVKAMGDLDVGSDEGTDEGIRDWIEVSFKILNLHFLLSALLHSSGLRYIKIHYRQGYDILLAYRRDRYVAALVRHNPED